MLYFSFSKKKILLIIGVSLIIACDNNIRKPTSNGKTLLNDSVFFYLFLNEKWTDVVTGNYLLDNDLKVGLYALAFIELDSQVNIGSILPNYKFIEFNSMGKFEFPSEFPQQMGFFEAYAWYRYFLKTNEFLNYDIRVDAFNLLKDKATYISSELKTFRPPVLKDELYSLYLNDTLPRESEKLARYDSLILEVEKKWIFVDNYFYQRNIAYYDSILEIYPNWNYLNIRKFKCYREGKEYEKAVAILKNLYAMEYKPLSILKEILSIYTNNIPNSDSLSIYINKFEKRFSNECCGTVAFYYLEIENHEKLIKHCDICFLIGSNKDSMEARVYLVDMYLAKQNIAMVDQLLNDFKQKNPIDESKEGLTYFKRWEILRYHRSELALLLLKKDYLGFIDLTFTGGGYVTPSQELLTKEGFKDLVKQVYKVAIDEDSSNFDNYFKNNFSQLINKRLNNELILLK